MSELEGRFDESARGEWALVGGGIARGDQWKAVREYCVEGRHKFQIPYVHTVELVRIAGIYKEWRQDSDGGKARKEECIRYFTAFPELIRLVSWAVKKKDYGEVFYSNELRGKVGQVFGVLSHACCGSTEALAEKLGIPLVRYYFEDGPGADSIHVGSLQYGRVAEIVCKRSEPTTDIADIIAYSTRHVLESQKPYFLTDNIAAHQPTGACKIIEINKGQLIELREASAHFPGTYGYGKRKRSRSSCGGVGSPPGCQ